MCVGMSLKTSVSKSSLQTTGVFPDSATRRLIWQPGGHKIWDWQGHQIHYISPDIFGEDVGSKKKKPSLLLIHGFGASSFHWRYNIPHLSHKYNVYAIDLLGFGLSDKPIVDYNVEVWRDQVLSFIEEVVHKGDSDSRTPCVVAGNSLGGFTALYAAASDKATSKNLISGCILLNAACRFRPPSLLPANPVESPKWAQNAAAKLQRFVIGLSFLYTKRPGRIAQVLRQVYPSDPEKVDAELVESIRVPSLHPNAAEVFYRVVAKNGNGPQIYADDLLAHLKVPLLLLWGSKVCIPHIIILPSCFVFFFFFNLIFSKRNRIPGFGHKLRTVSKHSFPQRRGWIWMLDTALTTRCPYR